MKLKGKKNETFDAHAASIQPNGEDTSANRLRSREEIRLRAYEIYLERSGLPGNELGDWLQAERELERAARRKTAGLPIGERPNETS